MKAHLLHPAADAELKRPLPWNAGDLAKDLDLQTLIDEMAQGDEVIEDTVRKVLLLGFDNDIATIRYRQDVVREALSHPQTIRELYAIAVEGVDEAGRQYVSALYRHPDYVLRHAIEHLERFGRILRKLRKLARSRTAEFSSQGWSSFFDMVERELNDEYLASVDSHLAQLKFRNGVLLGARLGAGNKGDSYTLHRPPSLSQTWLAWLRRAFVRRPPPSSFSVHPRDQSGARALAELRNRGFALVADALGQSRDHVRSFFEMLRTEVAFHVGCLNLSERLASKGEPVCFPLVAPADERKLSFSSLYDVCLALNTNDQVVGNDVAVDHQDLMIVTGANQGGKSTFLRSVGLAQLMMQCGMFVPAQRFLGSTADGVFTHYKREEDILMESGKLDEELRRMSDIVDHVTPSSIVLFNESFASTNEREGSEIARQVISTLLEERVRMVCVTHLYDFARKLFDSGAENILFLRAPRTPDGKRTFKLIEGGPLPTSFGEDLYNRLFGNADREQPASIPDAEAARRTG